MSKDAVRIEHDADDRRPPTQERPAYEPPRIEKKRSVSRATLFTGTGPLAAGLTASG